MKRGIVIIWMIWVAMTLLAQKAVVSGIVVDRSTGEPVAGASVTADGLSVVTNEDGFFVLKSEQPQKSIVVSHVGYSTRQVAVDSQTQQLKIQLLPTAIQLREVLVTAENAREIVDAAIARISQNYSRQPELYRCFYRETAKKRQHFICVAEGVVDMYKTGYHQTANHDRVAISKGRRLLSPKRSDTLSVKVMGGPVAPIQLDIVKNPDILLNEQDLACYKFQMERYELIDNRTQYVVSFSPRYIMPYPLYSGKLYIDRQTLAFTRAELSLDMSDREKATQFMLVRKPIGVRFKPRELTCLINYRYENGITRISYIRNTFRFNCDWKRRLLATSFTACCEMVVTDKTSENVQPISGRSSFDSRDAFYDKVDYFRDPTFWDNYNIIEPTVSLDEAIGRLVKKFK